jgi:hypothetical protein
MMKRIPVLVLLACVAGCGKDSPTAPTPTPSTPTPPPVQTLYEITGRVAIGSTSGTGIPNATVAVNDGPNAGKSVTTDGNGRYTIGGLTFAGMSVNVSASGYDSVARGVTLTSGVTSTTVNFALLPSVRWSKTGSGNQVFDMPAYLTRVRIQGSTRSRCENFVVYVASRLIVNVILGTCSVANAPSYDGTHLVSGGTVETQISTGVDWTFTEVR